MDDVLSRVNRKIIRDGKRTKGERGILGENLVYLGYPVCRLLADVDGFRIADDA
jgi:hypothetical protein